MIVAAVLFAFIFFFERHWRKPEPELQPMLPRVKASAVTTVLVRPAGQLEIRAERTNDVWHITRPVSYPARNDAVETLLVVLEHLAPAGYISARELRQRPKFDEEYGFTAPQVSVTLQQGEEHCQILFGMRTAPGDQVFVQAVGTEGVYVADAELLKLIPRSVNQWLDTAMVDSQGQACDRLILTNGVKIIEFLRDPASGLWSLTRPIHARANSELVADSLQRLLGLHAVQFITNGRNADLEGFGLQPAGLSLTLARDTNVLASVQFGRSPTNAPGQVYARRDGMDCIATVSNLWLEPWLAPVSDFRDRHLLTYVSPVRRIEVRGTNSFILQSESTDAWKVVSDTIPVDAELVKEFLKELASLRIVQFKDAVTESDLPAYGLTNPVREIVVQMAAGEDPAATNLATVQLQFGAIQDERIYVRRLDEDSVYAVPAADYLQLPTAGWQLRERRLWHFTENQVARVVVRQQDKVRELIHQGTNVWVLAPGSEGFINEAAVEEVVHRFGELVSTLWTARGEGDPAAYGFDTNRMSFEFHLKTGGQLSVQLGGMAPSQYPYAAVILDGEKWVFEFPRALYHFAMMYLAITPEAP